MLGRVESRTGAGEGEAETGRAHIAAALANAAYVARAGA